MHEKPSFELLVKAIQKTPQIYSLLMLPVVAPRGRRDSPYCLRYHAFQKQDPEITEQELN